ncbi:MAG: aminopeptidase [Gemmatimonadota bacterium]|nr:aminopeptidase [Gemmatimonadota bacterium]
MSRTRSALIAVLPLMCGLNLELGYYWHLVRGQAQLLWNRQPVADMLANRRLDPGVRERLEFIKEVRRFAEQRVGLARSRNYTTYIDIGEGPVSWQLTASPKDRIEPVQWTYPVVGRFPYRGYFDPDRAKRERDRLEARDFDTSLRPVGGYSTLGWFADPILSPMLRYSDGDLAELIIHELAHATVWIPGRVSFNESLATFVGEAGALQFMRHRYGQEAAVVTDMLDRRSDKRIFDRFMRGVAEELQALYGSKRSYEEKLKEREVVFERAKRRFSRLDLKTGAYSRFPRRRLNNAVMMAYRTYHEKVDVFENVYRAVGGDLKAAVRIFKESESQTDPSRYLEDWLAGNTGRRR